VRLIASVFFVVFLGGCSTIDRTSDIANHRLSAGQSTKSDVVTQIGLPNKVERKDKSEFWIFSGKELKQDYFIPLPVAAHQISPNTYQVYYRNIGPTLSVDFVPTLVCVFNEQGVLTDIFDPRKGEGKK
jgi:hypothetical protein